METKIMWILIYEFELKHRFSLKRLCASILTTSRHILRSLSFHSKCGILLIIGCCVLYWFPVSIVHHQAINIECSVELLGKNVIYLLIQDSCFVLCSLNLINMHVCYLTGQRSWCSSLVTGWTIRGSSRRRDKTFSVHKMFTPVVVPHKPPV